MTATTHLFRPITGLLEDCGPDGEPDARALIADVAFVLGMESDVPVKFVQLLVTQACFHLARETKAAFAAIESVTPPDIGV